MFEVGPTTPASEPPTHVQQIPRPQPDTPLGAKLIWELQSAGRSKHEKCWHFASGSINGFPGILTLFRPVGTRPAATPDNLV